MVDVEQIYQEIANFIRNSIANEWAQAWIEVELGEDYASAIGRYYKPGEQKLYGFRVGEETVATFAALRKEVEKPGHALWQRAKFILQPDGQFNLEFVYPD